MALVSHDPFRYDPFRSISNSWHRFPEHDRLFRSVAPWEFGSWIDRPWYSARRPLMLPEMDTAARVTYGKDKFYVDVDVHQFKPHEITVTVDDNTVTVEGKHEERPDDQEYISKQFMKTYLVPKGHDASRVESKLSSDGVLTISAPRLADSKVRWRQLPFRHHERHIPVKYTGLRAIDNKPYYK